MEYAEGRDVSSMVKERGSLLRPDRGERHYASGLARGESALGAVADSELITTGSVLATIDDMSPEQALDTKQADARSDFSHTTIGRFPI